MKMSEFGDVDDLFEELFRFAERLLEQPLLTQPRARGTAPQPVQSHEPDEVIVGREDLAYLLHAPGYDSNDFLVSVSDDSIEVKTNDFIRRKMLGSMVHPESAVTIYRNGVLSVRMKRMRIRIGIIMRRNIRKSIHEWPV